MSLQNFLPEISTENLQKISESLGPLNELFEGENEQFTEYSLFFGKIHPTYKNYSGNAIEIGRAEDLSSDEHNALHEYLLSLTPWRKGPFNLFGHDIDAEWRSDMKWNRIEPELPDLAGKTVCDVGCGNGYFLFKILQAGASRVLGLDPTRKFKRAFESVQIFAREPGLRFDLGGWQTLHYIPRTFDAIFAMGIVYHHSDPLELLKTIRGALKPKGWALIESQGIQGDDPVALFPRKKYCGASGMYFLPTAACLENWLYRSGFKNVKLLHNIPLSLAEQRRTAWADVNSLQEHLLQSDQTRTMEDYPAPWRSAFLVQG